MHNLAFQFKRAHWRSIAVASQLSRVFGLTPQRFDLLRALRTEPFTQSSLRAHFGVTRSTISRMLRALENIGLIYRKKYVGRRSRYVELTEKGLDLISRAIRFCKNPMTRVFEQMYRFDKPRWRRAWAVESACDVVQCFAHFLGDKSTFCYPTDGPGPVMWLA